MQARRAVCVLGVGNVLWADEGFGVRAVEALHAAWEFPAAVELLDGGTLGLFLAEYVENSERLLLLDAIDFGLAPGSLRVIRDADVPAWGATKLSPHQTGFNDILALAQLRDAAPARITLIGVQPEELGDFGGSLRAVVRSRLVEVVELAAAELAAWGFAGVRRAPGALVEPLHDRSLALGVYESGRPSADAACRSADPRVLALRAVAPGR
jgi:hydrogenase maturation protease